MRQTVKDWLHVLCFIIGLVLIGCEDDGTLSFGVWLLEKLLGFAFMAYGLTDGQVIIDIRKWINK